MGKFTISIAIFNSFLLNYQRVDKNKDLITFDLDELYVSG